MTPIQLKIKMQKLYKLNYDYVINNDLRIMDTASISLAKENKIPILVFSILREEFSERYNRW